MDLRIVDVHDREVPVGEIGELIVRTDAPWALNSGYYKIPRRPRKRGATAGFILATAFARMSMATIFSSTG